MKWVYSTRHGHPETDFPTRQQNPTHSHTPKTPKTTYYRLVLIMNKRQLVGIDPIVRRPLDEDRKFFIANCSYDWGEDTIRAYFEVRNGLACLEEGNTGAAKGVQRPSLPCLCLLILLSGFLRAFL